MWATTSRYENRIRDKQMPVTLKDIADQLKFIAAVRYENYENYDEVREADMQYLFKLEDAYRENRGIIWGERIA